MSRPTTPLPSFVPQKEQPSFVSPPRSSTHPVKPRHHVPHHPHRVHHHHRDKSVPQSAIQPSTLNPFYGSSSFGDFVTKTTTAGRADGGGTSQEDVAKREKQRERQREKEEVVNREREKAQWREVEKLRMKRTTVDNDLRTSLTTLSTLSTTTTRRLDYTYYALLSSLSSLTTTITSLRALSTSTRTLSTHFTTSTSSLSSEIKTQIESADRGFEQQARRISDLETRMKKGRERVQGLGERLEVVRLKVEKIGERDREGRKAVGRRLKMLWGFLGFWGVLAFVLVVARHWPGVGVDVRGARLVELANGTWDGVDAGVGKGGEGRSKETSRSEKAMRTSRPEDPVLKLFDEL